MCAGDGSSFQTQHQPPSTTITPPPPYTLSKLLPPSPTSPLGSEAKEFIEPCVEFDATSDLGGRTALHLAIAHQHTRVVNELLSHTGQSIKCMEVAPQKLMDCSVLVLPKLYCSSIVRIVGKTLLLH